jgi:predicted Fe-Mo cluster-binding NifX family protein
MKVVICSSGQGLDSLVDARFGRCPYFAIVDSKTGRSEFLENTAGRAFHGAGVSAAQVVADKGVGAVLGINFGPNAVNVLQAAGIKIYVLPDKGGLSLTVAEALKKYQAGEVKTIDQANQAPHRLGGG